MAQSTVQAAPDPPAPVAAGLGRILLVEDSPLLIKTVERILGTQGHEVVCAADGQEALKKLEGFQPHVIISDWMMEPLDGVELCRTLRADPRHSGIYFLLLTAKDRLEDRIEAFQAGVDEYVSKPVVDQELVERVRVGLRINHLQTDLASSNDQLQASLDRIRAELEIIGGIQRSLLPDKLPAGRLRTGIFYRPCDECGGDYYDFLPVDDDSTAVVIADVSGHGSPAMVAMAIIRSLVHTVVPQTKSPAEALAEINRRLWHHLPTEQYATMLVGFWDSKRRRLTYGSAGHPAPLCIRADSGKCERLPEMAGYPLKLVAEDAEYDQVEVRLQEGDRVALFTDGLIEAFSPAEEQFGVDRLAQSLQSHGDVALDDLPNRVLEDVLAFAGDRPQEDDLTMLVTEIV